MCKVHVSALLIYAVQYGELLTILKLDTTGDTVCLLRGFTPVLENGTPKLSRYGCLLFTLSRTIFLVDSSIILTAVSFVHECTNTCSFVEATVCQAQEREDVEGIELVFRHVWNNLEFSFNTASASKVGQN